MNSWKTKWHDSCRARYTVTFGDKVKEFITLNEDKSKLLSVMTKDILLSVMTTIPNLILTLN